MSFIKSLFNKKSKSINSYSDFWDWFEQNENKFYKVIKEQGNIDKVFFQELSPKLDELKDGIWFLAGMYDDTTAELILTADGIIKNIVFVEELVAAAPKIKNWKITALKQPSEENEFGINMAGYKFENSTMSFYSTDHESMPDEIDITITHKDYTEENRNEMATGIYLALDNNLGELNSVTTIDNVTIINEKDAEKELVPLEKLKNFLIWREKEFIEKYKGTLRDTENDNYSSLEATLHNDLPLLAIVNTDLLKWNNKASHPWVCIVEINYDGSNNNGMPNSVTYDLLNQIEDEIMLDLKDSDGYLNIGRQTADSVREIYFACNEFRKPSKIMHQIKIKYENKIELKFDIYKDKYWQSFNRFIPAP